MNYINKRAEEFARSYIRGQVSEYEKILDEAKTELYNIDDDLDKATFLRIVLEANERGYQKHLIDCHDKEKCQTNFAHESISYYLNQELNRLGIRSDNDPFTTEEKDIEDDKLDKILSDIQTLKDGQNIIYDDLKKELDELKELYILGKKKWHQLLLGKIASMVMSGIISETVSKEIISIMGSKLQLQ